MSWSDLTAHEYDLDNVFVFFSIEHFMFITIALSATFLILHFAHYIKEWKYEKSLRIGIASLMVILELGYHTHNFINGKFSIPLHVCSVAVIISIYLLLTNSKKAFGLVFYLGLLGGYTALFLPDMSDYTYINMRYYHFIIIHLLIVVIPLYYYKAYGYRLTLHSVRRAVLLLLAMTPLAVYINTTMDRNYMFIGEKPDPIAAYLPPWPFYILLFGVLIIGLFYSMYFLSNLKIRKERRKLKTVYTHK